VQEPVAGATHLAARRLVIDAATGTLYAFAYEIDLDADVTGAASLFAAEVDLDAEIGGNLRLFAREAEVRRGADGLGPDRGAGAGAGRAGCGRPDAGGRKRGVRR
jgi:hypothetical protein